MVLSNQTDDTFEIVDLNFPFMCTTNLIQQRFNSASHVSVFANTYKISNRISVYAIAKDALDHSPYS